MEASSRSQGVIYEPKDAYLFKTVPASINFDHSPEVVPTYHALGTVDPDLISQYVAWHDLIKLVSEGCKSVDLAAEQALHGNSKSISDEEAKQPQDVNEENEEYADFPQEAISTQMEG